MTNNNPAIIDAKFDVVADTKPVYDGRRVSGAYKVNPDRMGDVDWSMSKQWATRPDDETFSSFDELLNAAEHWESISHDNTVNIHNIVVSDSMEIIIPNHRGEYIPVDPTHLAFTQLCAAAETPIPANYLRKLPDAKRAARILREGLKDLAPDAKITAYTADGGEGDIRELRSLAFTPETRTTNAQLLRALRPLLGDLTANNPLKWKTPGKINWGTMEHNPYDMDAQNSLFMGPEDMQCFVCQDGHPIEIGKTRRGLPDIFFPGLMFGGSEVKSQSTWFTGMMLQGVCCNLSLRGVMGKKTHRINHTKNGNLRINRQSDEIFDSALEISSFIKQVTGMKNERIKAITDSKKNDDKDEARMHFLQRLFVRAIGKGETQKIMQIGFNANQHPIETVFDAHEALTEAAKTIRIQEKRREYEFAAYSLLAKFSD
jgi:hypothetical protein